MIEPQNLLINVSEISNFCGSIDLLALELGMARSGLGDQSREKGREEKREKDLQRNI